MIIVDFKYHVIGQKENATTTFKKPEEVIKFVSDKSIEHDEFEVIRINRYVDGELIPQRLSIHKGRIELDDVPPAYVVKPESPHDDTTSAPKGFLF